MKIKIWVCAALLFCANTFAASTTNMVDQWGTPGETGWGLSIQQQDSTLFINMFVYDQGGQPTWYIGAVTPGVPAASGHVTFTGDWFRTNGSYFGGPWNQAAAGISKVGTITFDVDTVTTANLTYSVNGVTVTKRVERQLWSYENYNGAYLGGIVEDVSGCAFDGHREVGAVVAITQTNNTSMSMSTTQLDGGACTYIGSYSQLGHMGTFAGNYSCNDGDAGSFTAFEMEKTPSGMTGRFVAQSTSGCSGSGRFGGLLR